MSQESEDLRNSWNYTSAQPTVRSGYSSGCGSAGSRTDIKNLDTNDVTSHDLSDSAENFAFRDSNVNMNDSSNRNSNILITSLTSLHQSNSPVVLENSNQVPYNNVGYAVCSTSHDHNAAIVRIPNQGNLVPRRIKRKDELVVVLVYPFQSQYLLSPHLLVQLHLQEGEIRNEVLAHYMSNILMEYTLLELRMILVICILMIIITIVQGFQDEDCNWRK